MHRKHLYNAHLRTTKSKDVVYLAKNFHEIEQLNERILEQRVQCKFEYIDFLVQTLSLLCLLATKVLIQMTQPTLDLCPVVVAVDFYKTKPLQSSYKPMHATL